MLKKTAAFLLISIYCCLTIFAQKNTTSEIVLLIDTSGSMIDYHPAFTNAVLPAFFRSFAAAGDVIHFVTYDEKPIHHFSIILHSADDITRLIMKIQSLLPLGTFSDIPEALSFSSLLLEKTPGSKKIIAVVSDGKVNIPLTSRSQNVMKNGFSAYVSQFVSDCLSKNISCFFAVPPYSADLTFIPADSVSFFTRAVPIPDLYRINSKKISIRDLIPVREKGSESLKAPEHETQKDTPNFQNTDEAQQPSKKEQVSEPNLVSQPEKEQQPEAIPVPQPDKVKENTKVQQITAAEQKTLTEHQTETLPVLQPSTAQASDSASVPQSVNVQENTKVQNIPAAAAEKKPELTAVADTDKTAAAEKTPAGEKKLKQEPASIPQTPAEAESPLLFKDQNKTDETQKTEDTIRLRDSEDTLKTEKLVLQQNADEPEKKAVEKVIKADSKKVLTAVPKTEKTSASSEIKKSASENKPDTQKTPFPVKQYLPAAAITVGALLAVFFILYVLKMIRMRSGDISAASADPAALEKKKKQASLLARAEEINKKKQEASVPFQTEKINTLSLTLPAADIPKKQTLSLTLPAADTQKKQISSLTLPAADTQKKTAQPHNNEEKAAQARKEHLSALLTERASNSIFDEKKESITIELCVENQNPDIGLRNVHTLTAGSRKTLGGGYSSFCIFLYPVPVGIAELHFDGYTCRLLIYRPEFFPDTTDEIIENCIDTTIKVVSSAGVQMSIKFQKYVSETEKLNELLLSIIPDDEKERYLKS